MGVPAHSFLCHFCMLMRLWSFLCMCASQHNMLTLQEIVHISTGTSSSDVLGIYFWHHVVWHVSCLWVKLTTAGWVNNSCTTVLTDCKGVLSHFPFSVLSWRHELPLFLNEESWGSRMPTSSFSTSLSKCLGTLEGQRWSLNFSTFWMGSYTGQ